MFSPSRARRPRPAQPLFAAQAVPESRPAPVAHAAASAAAVKHAAPVGAAGLVVGRRTREPVWNQGQTTAAPAGVNLLGVAVSTRVMGLVGDPAAGVFLAQLIYWSRRTPDLAQRDGWIAKRSEELQQETGMSWKVQRRARQLLIGGGWLEERLLSMPARLEFRLNLSALVRALHQGRDIQVDDATLSWEKLCDRRDPSFDRLMGRCFLFHGVLTQVLPLSAAVLASRLESRPQHSDAASETYWWRMHRDAWKAETGLSRDQWQTARKTLSKIGVLIERGHNFPRRIDLALNPVAMRALLAHCKGLAVGAHQAPLLPMQVGRPEAGQEWEKQAGGFGRRPDQPSLFESGSLVSPDPAAKNRPILPTKIAQSRPYPIPQVLPTTPQQPLPQAPADSQFFPAFGAGVGSKGLLKGAFHLQVSDWINPVMHSKAHDRAGMGESRPAATAPAGTLALNEAALLHWPRALQEHPEELGLAMKLLAGLSAEQQQQVLDEIVFIEHHQHRAVRNHLGLLRTLATKARNGEFNPEGAHKVAKMRSERMAREANVLAQKPTQAAPSGTEASSAPGGMSEQQRQKFKEIQQSLLQQGLATQRRRAVG